MTRCVPSYRRCTVLVMVRVIETPITSATNSTRRNSPVIPSKMLGMKPRRSSVFFEKRTSRIMDGRDLTCSTALSSPEGSLPFTGFSQR